MQNTRTLKINLNIFIIHDFIMTLLCTLLDITYFRHLHHLFHSLFLCPLSPLSSQLALHLILLLFAWWPSGIHCFCEHGLLTSGYTTEETFVGQRPHEKHVCTLVVDEKRRHSCIQTFFHWLVTLFRDIMEDLGGRVLLKKLCSWHQALGFDKSGPISCSLFWLLVCGWNVVQ